MPQVALVTGASRGIGLAIALSLADDGFDVAVNDMAVNRERLDAAVEMIRKKSRRSIAVVADVSVEDQVRDMVANVVENLGALDVVLLRLTELRCTSVRISRSTASVEDWDRTFAVNARGVFLCYKYAGRQMIAQGRGGRIIGAASLRAKLPCVSMGAYGASKWAVRGLTQTAALEFGPYGITVNSYAPGAIDTEMLDEIRERTTQYESKKDFMAKKAEDAAAKITGEPQDIASLVSFLADKKSRFITGKLIVIFHQITADGGRHFS
ncbi:NAD(P)-binding protein [Fistulina hepatica ATCC 64428]|nr:NAD(P)-binding protein [Fistulina hepatica ATCC 64428]